MIHCDTLLHNATDIITKCDSYFITKCGKNLLQNASGFLLQNATVITNCDDFITKCDSYYKMRRLLQIATVQILRERILKNISICEIHYTKYQFIKIMYKIITSLFL